ncbi:NAD-dependent epimerase/dehydratase family protein [Desulfocastanea catecholica]
MKNANDVIESDLEYIITQLHEELPLMSGKRLLITGGAGFLGYYLTQSILRWNIKNPEKPAISVVVYDNFMRGVPNWLDTLQAKSLLTAKKYDVIDPLPDDMGDFQFIIHAATIASPIYYRRHPIETMDANIYGLRHLLDYCIAQKERKKPVEAFLFYSTSEIYGDPTPDNIPTPETYRGNVSCTGPRACYDESKRYGETMAVNFARQYHLPIRLVRPFNNYGPGLKITDKRALPDFARNVLSGEDIVLLSDGSPTRTFCYVADAIVGYFKVLLLGQDGESYNIGVDKPEISIRQLAENVIKTAQELFDYQGKLVFKRSEDKEYLTDNPNRRCPVIDKAREHLGYNPSIKLEDGLKRSLLWYFDNQEVEEEK